MGNSYPQTFFFTDFGIAGPYLGQMEAAFCRSYPGPRPFNLCADAPASLPRPSAYLLAGLVSVLPAAAAIVAVVDPGVGGDRRALLVEVDGRLYTGPDNGLLSRVIKRGQVCRAWQIEESDLSLSASFHGRDLFAPTMARVLQGNRQGLSPVEVESLQGISWPDEVPEIVYVDHYGNLFTGIRAASLPSDSTLRVQGMEVGPARVFGDMPPDTPFWYENSCGLVEIAVNCGRADEHLGLKVGDWFSVS